MENALPLVPTAPFGDPASAKYGAVGVDGCGRFMVAWGIDGYPINEAFNHDNTIVIQRVLPTGSMSGGWQPLTANQPLPPVYHSAEEDNEMPSIAISPLGRVRVSWIGSCPACVTLDPPSGPYDVTGKSLSIDYLFDDTPPVTLAPFPEPTNLYHHHPSAGRSDVPSARSVWTSSGEGILGILEGASVASANQIRPCGVNCFTTKWQPALAMRPNGDFCVAWAEAEHPDQFVTPFNIALRVYDASGTLVDEVAGPNSYEWVNDPGLEIADSDQLSPSVAFDAQGNIIVTWVGLDQSPMFHIFARRFHWAGGSAPITARSAPFIVDNDSTPGFGITNQTDPHPTVALVQGEPQSFPADIPGRFIIAWNSPISQQVVSEIRAQYFESDGRPMGQEFRVNQATGDTGFNGLKLRKLDDSGRHTVAYGGDGHVMAAWTACHGDIFSPCSGSSVHYTLLPVGYAEYQDSLSYCMKGDIDNDQSVSLLDIGPFINLLFADLTDWNIIELCPGDMNNDARINGLDIQCFVNTLVGNECTPPTLRIIDCNLNGIPDDEDITAQTSSDVNTNGVPDECEPDCNDNDVPDDWDIAQATSYDCDTDGIPDECGEDCNENGIADVCDVNPADPDGNSLVSADCNTNGYPDECEPDCNTNGVPDDCDMDPTDPDGDEWVSPDCNNNEYPDECDLSLPPPFGSSDCNTNGVPDECDIAACENDPACDDCNSNGIPDGCDIAAEISEDVNTNGIPDECEGEGLMGGGGGESMAASGESGESEWSEEAAWEAFYAWAIQQCWGPDCPDSGEVQFQRMVDKMRELGLPVGAPDR
ncbi:hypothetical protein B7486_10270 [cyanobacterium TDX16]|nr:hypothetical protein B7486_10270 [cyanobacterium TDX16]